MNVGIKSKLKSTRLHRLMYLFKSYMHAGQMEISHVNLCRSKLSYVNLLNALVGGFNCLIHRRPRLASVSGLYFKPLLVVGMEKAGNRLTSQSYPFVSRLYCSKKHSYENSEELLWKFSLWEYSKNPLKELSQIFSQKLFSLLFFFILLLWCF